MMLCVQISTALIGTPVGGAAYFRSNLIELQVSLVTGALAAEAALAAPSLLARACAFALLVALVAAFERHDGGMGRRRRRRGNWNGAPQREKRVGGVDKEA